MYAIVEIAGLQYKVEKDQQLYVNRLKEDEGSKVIFDRVLLTDNGNIEVGAPVIDGISVEAKIIEHLKGDKVIVFKKKRRKGYRKKRGHRQHLSKIEIVSIGGDKSTSKKEESATPKKADSKPAKKDDLTLIEGIGPKSAEALIAGGIDSFEKLSELSEEEIKKILAEASSSLARLDPQTWQKQAKMAAEGKFDELKAWQDELDGGTPSED
ncbi:MAG TPA: 50S ribosomal protein L21 [Flavobacteriaceae bacterium]|nr:50S ribosomal protein L21 [Flavobacteriaceae bacterium]